MSLLHLKCVQSIEKMFKENVGPRLVAHPPSINRGTFLVGICTQNEKRLSNAGHRYSCIRHCSVCNGGVLTRWQSAMTINEKYTS